MHIVEDQAGLPRGLTTYTAHDIDDIALDAIRSDEGMASVARAVRVPLADGETYKAPLRNNLPA